jgi:predicted signal transduction protein with EAL and GGDEF domain
LARRFETCASPTGLLARLGGDEFALLETGIDAPQQALSVAMTLLECLREPCQIADARVEVRASIGIALAPDHGRTTNELFKNADAALYAAKELGGDRAHLFDDSLGFRLQRRLEIISDLGRALKERQFVLHYQPQVDALSGRVTTFEALLRWQHPEKGMVTPDQFIPVAEETGQIIAIGAWVLEQACRDALTWSDGLTVAVNLSAVQLNSRTIIDTVRHALALSGLPPHRLELEVTESALVQDDASAHATLSAFRAMHIEIALDDFGTGYSMLSYLRNFPFDKLKIDRSFVMTLTDTVNDGNQAIFRAIVDLAAALDLRTVAEGVDSQEKLVAVRDYGCNDVQGYLVARPMAAREIPQFLATWQSW